MILDPAIGWALPQLQAEAEARMHDTIRFIRPGEGDPEWDPDLKDYVVPGVLVYEGKCRIRWANPAPQDGDTGDASWAVDRTVTVSLPVSDPAAGEVTDGMVGTVTAAGLRSDAQVGMRLFVLVGHRQSDTIARRIPCQVVSRDAGV